MAATLKVDNCQQHPRGQLSHSQQQQQQQQLIPDMEIVLHLLARLQQFCCHLHFLVKILEFFKIQILNKLVECHIHIQFIHVLTNSIVFWKYTYSGFHRHIRTSVSSSKTQRNAENACVNASCKRILKLRVATYLFHLKT